MVSLLVGSLPPQVLFPGPGIPKAVLSADCELERLITKTAERSLPVRSSNDVVTWSPRASAWSCAHEVIATLGVALHMLILQERWVDLCALEPRQGLRF